jgi:hypothetical protein
MADIKKFDYEGQKISFEFSDGNKMINATEMAKPFPTKRVNNFLRAQQTKDYISLLEDRYAKKRNGTTTEVLRVVQGGDAALQGTWMDEKLALKFAAWLSPAFELWVYDKIEELLVNRTVTLKDFKPSSNLQTLRLLIDQMEQQEIMAQRMREDINDHDDRITDLEAKIISIDENYYSISGYCSLNAILCPQEQARKWGMTATQLSHSKGMPVGKAYDAKFGEINTYHLDILKRIVT